MTIRWATGLYRGILLPSFAMHYKYYQRKAALDRVLEKFHPAVNVSLGLLFGCVIYLIAVPLRPNGIDKSLRTLQGMLVDTLANMNVDFRQEFYPFAIQRIRSEIVSRALVARDEAEARRQVAEVEELKAQMAARVKAIREEESRA